MNKQTYDLIMSWVLLLATAGSFSMWQHSVWAGLFIVGAVLLTLKLILVTMQSY